MRTVVTFGTFDLFHVGHLRILKRAYELGDRLVVGISSDDLTLRKKGKTPVHSYMERSEIVSSIQYVNDFFVEEELSLKREYLLAHKADILVMGDDWKGNFDEFGDICEVIYLPRTPSISTTMLIEKIKT